MSAHPKPSDMAADAYRETRMHSFAAKVAAEHDFAAGVTAERARVAADLAARAKAIRGRGPNEGAMIVVAYLETYAEGLEGKAQP